MLQPRPYLLVNKIQHYAWGTRGKDAFIPRFLGIEPDADQPYAELWMGTHPAAPSDVVVDGARAPLPRLVAEHPAEILGPRVSTEFNGKFPFLFKVLSAAEALSIQAHPDKAQAERLHARDPAHYPDGNHKPEIAIALDSLMALAGFKPFSEILQALEAHPELAGFVGQATVSRLRQAQQPTATQERDLVRTMYSVLMKRSLTRQEALADSINQLASRLHSKDALTEQEQIFLELVPKYPGDVGLFSIFLLNLVHLERGQGVFIGAGIPHAYLKGNIVECMAASDNVVRAGLTPKYKDVETLVEILTYETGPVSILNEGADQTETIYHTPASEFQVARWQLKSGQGWREIDNDTPAILLITQGQVRLAWAAGEERFQRGQSILIPAFLKEWELTANKPAELFVADIL
jgi:mannose-6-phosphate isomerase